MDAAVVAGDSAPADCGATGDGAVAAEATGFAVGAVVVGAAIGCICGAGPDPTAPEAVLVVLDDGPGSTCGNAVAVVANIDWCEAGIGAGCCCCCWW